MDSKIKLGLCGAVVAWALSFFCYSVGYDKAQAEGELALEQLKLSQAQAVIDAQNKVKVEYNEKVETLNADLANARKLNAERLRQLQKFTSTSRDLETCTRERRELGELAIRGEDLLYRADAYLGALVQ